MELKYKFLLLFFVLIQLLNAQATFINRSQLYKSHIPTRSVMPGAAIDFDGDLIDDLVILDRGKLLKIVKSHGSYFQLTLLDSITTTNVKEWTLAAGDLTNSGKSNIIVAGEYNPASVVTIDKNKLSRKSFPSGIYAQGSNIVDIDNDGWLDYYVCNDDGPNKIYINDKSGNLVLTNVIDFLKDDTTDGSGNYGSEWIDVNGDLLPDLCISKCRAGVDSPTDPRRVNRLYINMGDGTFVEQGKAFGLDSGSQTWVTAFGDIDNDGDQDALVINHYAPHELMENVDGQKFEPLQLPAGFSSFSLQAIMRDFDNDGWLDVLLTGVEGSILMHNNKDKTFTIIKDIIGPAPVRSMACGDFNDDGFLDVHAHLGEPINEVGVTNDQLWLNQPNDNHFIKINLTGHMSNTSGIGARLELYGSWGRQVRQVKGGESYGIFNSLQQIFGLGQAKIADSLVVYWPSGVINRHYELDPDMTYHVQEGRCISPQIPLYLDVLLVGDSNIVINALGGFTHYLWSNGATDAAISVGPGTYHVRMTDDQGCTLVSKPVEVRFGCFSSSTKLLNLSGSIKKCAGDIEEIFASSAATYTWNDGSTEPFVTVDQTGWVTLTATDFCGNTLKDSVYVEFVDVVWQTKGDTVQKGQQAVLTSTNPNTAWFEYPDVINPIHIGDTLRTVPLESTTTYAARASEIVDRRVDFVGENKYPTSNFYGANTTAGNLIFNVEKKCMIHAVNVNTDTDGLRRIIITDMFNNVIFSKDVWLESGITKIILDARLNPGFNYRISTDESINLSSLGFRSPRLVRSFGNTSFPYRIDNTLSIVSSSFGAQYFMYFYDWEVHHELQTCNSELVDVTAIVEIDNAVTDLVRQYVSLYPNPAKDRLQILLSEDVDRAFISNMQHQVIVTDLTKESTLDISSWPSGMYMLNIVVGDKVHHIKWVKQ